MLGSGEHGDPFDNVNLGCDNDVLWEKAHENGRDAGRRAGYEKGFEFGLKMATSFGMEVGYYRSYAEIWKRKLTSMKLDADAQQQQQQQQVANERRLKVLDQLIELCNIVPSDNEHSGDVERILEKLRAKSKQATSLLSHRITSSSAPLIFPGPTINFDFTVTSQDDALLISGVEDAPDPHKSTTIDTKSQQCPSKRLDHVIDF